MVDLDHRVARPIVSATFERMDQLRRGGSKVSTTEKIEVPAGSLLASIPNHLALGPLKTPASDDQQVGTEALVVAAFGREAAVRVAPTAALVGLVGVAGRNDCRAHTVPDRHRVAYIHCGNHGAAAGCPRLRWRDGGGTGTSRRLHLVPCGSERCLVRDARLSRRERESHVPSGDPGEQGTGNRPAERWISNPRRISADKGAISAP